MESGNVSGWNMQGRALGAAAAQCLLAYPWLGNVRELENVMQRSLVLCEGTTIEPEHLSFEPPPSIERAVQSAPAAVVAPAAGDSLRDLAGKLQLTEQQIIIEALRDHRGSRTRVAERLGISPRTLRYKLARMRAAGIDLLPVLGSAA